jgi:hypothetical protein
MMCFIVSEIIIKAPSEARSSTLCDLIQIQAVERQVYMQFRHCSDLTK